MTPVDIITLSRVLTAVFGLFRLGLIYTCSKFTSISDNIGSNCIHIPVYRDSKITYVRINLFISHDYRILLGMIYSIRDVLLLNISSRVHTLDIYILESIIKYETIFPQYAPMPPPFSK